MRAPEPISVEHVVMSDFVDCYTAKAHAWLQTIVLYQAPKTTFPLQQRDQTLTRVRTLPLL